MNNSRLNSTRLFKLNHFTDVRKTYLYIVVTNNLPGILDHRSIDEINTLPRILDRGTKSLTSTLVQLLQGLAVVIWRTVKKPY